MREIDIRTCGGSVKLAAILQAHARVRPTPPVKLVGDGPAVLLATAFDMATAAEAMRLGKAADRHSLSAKVKRTIGQRLEAGGSWGSGRSLTPEDEARLVARRRDDKIPLRELAAEFNVDERTASKLCYRAGVYLLRPRPRKVKP